LAGLAICLVLFVWLWRNAHDLSFAFIWMGALLAPVLNARWLPAAVFAERYLYLPSVGFCWLVAWGATKAWRAAPAGGKSSPVRRLLWQAMPVALGLVAILYGVRTVRRNRDWRDDETVYKRILDEQPDAQFIRTNLGVVYYEHSDKAGAEREWLNSLGPLPPYASTLNDLGLLRADQKRYDEAIAYYQQAIQVRPKYADPHKNLGFTYAEMNRTGDAEREFREAVELAPLNSLARNAYGHFLLDQSRPAEAQQQFAASAADDPNSDALGNLGDLLARAGDVAKARAAYQVAIALSPFDNRSLVGLASLDEQAGRRTEALQEYRASLDMDPNNAGALAAVQRLSSPGGTSGAAAH
jgi:protein O-mannosyl-transferase